MALPTIYQNVIMLRGVIVEVSSALIINTAEERRSIVISGVQQIWNPERVSASLRVGNMNEAQIERRWVTERQGQVIGILEKMCSMKQILLIGVPCEVCEHCGTLAFKAEK
jgi:hypothetical protein